MPCCELMKAHVILLIGEQRGGREGEKRKERTQCLPLMPSIYLLNYPSFYKHLIPSHRQARAPVILLYFEELREVARRQSEATAYYITTDKIERPRKAGRERGREEERERERKRDPVESVLLQCY